MTNPAKEHPRESIAALIERDVIITGELEAPAGVIRINGTVNGRIHSGGEVEVGRTSVCHCEIHARKVDLFGTVCGDVQASELLVIHRGASLKGNAYTPIIVVESEADFEGEVRSVDQPRA
jgi:cytoskeletal protein CcmA (bactofilin family)